MARTPARVTSPSQIALIGQAAARLVVATGDLTIFAASMCRWMVSRLPYPHTFLPNFYQIGVRSVPVVALTGTFIGMGLAVQAYGTFRMMGLETLMGSIINVSLVKELCPVLAATMLAGRVGSAMAAQIGTMKVTEQIDALRCLGTDPIHYLVVPRFLACVILTPLLTIIADFMGLIGGAIVSTKFLGVDSFYYWKHSRSFVGMFEVLGGVGKSVVFGAAIALVSCHRGFQSKAGAEGVGRAATEAFVLSFVTILVCDFFMGMMLNSMQTWLFPDQIVSLSG